MNIKLSTLYTLELNQDELNVITLVLAEATSATLQAASKSCGIKVPDDGSEISFNLYDKITDVNVDYPA